MSVVRLQWIDHISCPEMRRVRSRDVLGESQAIMTLVCEEMTIVANDVAN